METVNEFWVLAIFAKNTIIDVRMGSKCASILHQIHGRFLISRDDQLLTIRYSYLGLQNIFELIEMSAIPWYG